MIKTAGASESRDLPDGEAGETGEPVEEVAVTDGDEGLGDFLQRDDHKKDEGGQGDEERASSEPAAGEGEVAEERERSEEDDVAGFVGVSDFMNEGPEIFAISGVRDDYGRDEEEDETDGDGADIQMLGEAGMDWLQPGRTAFQRCEEILIGSG